KPFQRAFKAEAGNKGFQPQNKPPVHTGGFDLGVCDGVKAGESFVTQIEKFARKSEKSHANSEITHPTN
ncbi:hypothetical protein J2T56_002967, partial [Natronobacillus azotifigens]|uniref:hypothetical protein n=1 Tax=Natronobacillus azotifigens TaxID=472978 RepID=UPI003D1B5F02